MPSYTMTCPSCGAGNRIPEEKEGKKGRCGRCHTQLPPLYSHPQQLSVGNFDSFISNYPGPVLAEFWAPW